MTHRRFRSRRLAFAVATAGLLGVMFAPVHAHAMQACYSDPIVLLSNGQTVDLSAQIADSSADVTSVSYILTLPTHVTPTQVVYTGGAFAGKEHFTYKNRGDTTRVYGSSTVLTTATAGIGLTAQSRVTGVYGQAQASASGEAGQNLAISVTQN